MSPAFLLLLILFVIFAYIYIFLFYVFNDYATEHSQVILEKKELGFLHSVSGIVAIRETVNYLKNLFGVLVFFSSFWSVRLLTYICVEHTNQRNYLVSLADEFFELKVKRHLKKHDVSY